MGDLPDDVVDAAERLTRLAREAVDDTEAAAYRADRDAALADYGYAARVREDDDGDVLVLYPSEWLEDGVIRVEAVQDRSRAEEIQLTGTGEETDWDAVDAHNRSVAETVEAEHGPVHGATARALADFAGNHYAKRIETLAPEERRTFKEEYFERNAWPTEAQRDVIDESVQLTVRAAKEKSTNETG
ncbi:MAG: rnhA operon protein [Salinirussus sp.]